MIKRLDKKGADATINIFIYLVIGAALVFGVVYLILQGSDKAGNILGVSYDALNAKELICAQGAITKSVWCVPTPVEGDRHMSCQYLNEEYNSSIVSEFVGTCGDSASQYCQKLKADEVKNFGDEYVDGVTCKGRGVDDSVKTQEELNTLCESINSTYVLTKDNCGNSGAPVARFGEPTDDEGNTYVCCVPK